MCGKVLRSSTGSSLTPPKRFLLLQQPNCSVNKKVQTFELFPMWQNVVGSWYSLDPGTLAKSLMDWFFGHVKGLICDYLTSRSGSLVILPLQSWLERGGGYWGAGWTWRWLGSRTTRTLRDRKDTRFTAVISLLTQDNSWWLVWASIFKLHLLILIAWLINIICSFVHGDTLNIFMVSAAHVPSGVDHLLMTSCGASWADSWTCLDLGSTTTDSEPLWIVAFLSDYLRKDSSSSIDEPVADLKNCQSGFLSKGKFLCITWVCIVSMFIQPSAEDKDGFFGEISSSLPGNQGSGLPQSWFFTAGVVVVISTGGGRVWKDVCMNHSSRRYWSGKKFTNCQKFSTVTVCIFWRLQTNCQCLTVNNFRKITKLQLSLILMNFWTVAILWLNYVGALASST